MAALHTEAELVAMRPDDLECDDKWLKGILDSKDQSRKRTMSTPENGRQKRQRKEKKIFDPSETDELKKEKRRRSTSEKPKEDDLLLHQHQSPFVIRDCSVRIQRLQATQVIEHEGVEIFTEEPEGEPEVEEPVLKQKVIIKQPLSIRQEIGVQPTAKAALFALSNEERWKLHQVAAGEVTYQVFSPDDPCNNLVPSFSCPKCKKEFTSLNRLLLHVDSAHEKFTEKVNNHKDDNSL